MVRLLIGKRPYEIHERFDIAVFKHRRVYSHIVYDPAEQFDVIYLAHRSQDRCRAFYIGAGTRRPSVRQRLPGSRAVVENELPENSLLTIPG